MFQIQPHSNSGFFHKSNNSKKINLKKLFLLLFFIYLALVLYVTLLAWNYGASLGPVGPGGRNYNFIPFRSIYRIAVFSPTVMDPIRILIGNIILFLPFGFLVPIVFLKLRNSILSTTLLGTLLSISIEMSQFLFTYRVSNIDDVILNTLGALIGAIVIKLCFFIKSKIVLIKM